VHAKIHGDLCLSLKLISFKDFKQGKNMNRQKKLQQLFKEKSRKANAKLAPKSNKPKYISKADRLKLEAEAAPESIETPEA
jgi:hypothetical protein